MRSLISPEKVIGKGAVAPEAFSRFIGGSSPGSTSSTISTAANKISNFSRPIVKPLPNQTNTVIQNISSNITNNVDNSVNKSIVSFRSEFQNTVGGIQKQVKETLGGLISNFTKDYQKRIQDNEANKPTNILKNFLELYRNAVGFVNFFGDGKNLKKIETTLKSLRKMFNESFEVAKLVRQTIVKIVKQLSNLPSASGKGGDLDLNVSVPGGPLKNSGQGAIGKFARSPRGKALGFTAAGLGAGAALGAGSMAMSSSGAQEAQRFQEEKLSSVRGQESSQNVPEGFLDSLGRIIERFTSAIENLVQGGKKSSGSSSGSAASSAPPPGDNPNPNDPGASGQTQTGNMQLSGQYEDKPYIQALLKTIRYAEGTSGPKGYNTMFGGGTFDTSKGWKHPDKVIRSGGYESAAAGAYQFMPDTWKMASDAIGAQDFSPRYQDMAAVYLIMKRLGILTEENLEKYLKSQGGFTSKTSAKLSPEWASLPTMSGSSFYGQPVKRLNELQRVFGFFISSPQPSKNNPQGAPQGKAQPQGAPQGKAQPQGAPQGKAQPPAPRPISSAVTNSPSQASTSTTNIETASLPPEITVIPGGGQNNQTVASQPSSGGEANSPDVSMFGDTTNPNNPYWSLPLTLGIINA
jgi:muramidase (phage lysozyme)